MENPAAEEIISETRTQVATRLLGLRTEWHGEGSGTVITDFDGYVAGVTITFWTNTLRRRNPAHVTLLNRLRYLLENRTGQHGFALWNGPAGECCGGFAAWRGKAPAVTPRLQWLHADPADALGKTVAAASLPLAELVARLLSWLGGLLELRDLLEFRKPMDCVLPDAGLKINAPFPVIVRSVPVAPFKLPLSNRVPPLTFVVDM